MATDLQVQCINKTNRQSPHDRIQNIGGGQGGNAWKFSVPEAIAGIKSGKWTFYTHVQGKRVKVIIATNEGTEYLKTEADGLQPNNLLALPECP